MKYLLLFLICFSANAEFRVDVNSQSGRSYSAEFETLEKAENWIEKNKSNNSWGEPGSFMVSTTDITAEKLAEKQAKDKKANDCMALNAKLNEFKNDKFTDLTNEELNSFLRNNCK